MLLGEVSIDDAHQSGLPPRSKARKFTAIGEVPSPPQDWDDVQAPAGQPHLLAHHSRRKSKTWNGARMALKTKSEIDEAWGNDRFSEDELMPGCMLFRTEYVYDYNVANTRLTREACVIIASKRSPTKRYKCGAMDIILLKSSGVLKKVRFPINRKHFGFAKP